MGRGYCALAGEINAGLRKRNPPLARFKKFKGLSGAECRLVNIREARNW